MSLWREMRSLGVCAFVNKKKNEERNEIEKYSLSENIISWNWRDLVWKNQSAFKSNKHERRKWFDKQHKYVNFVNNFYSTLFVLEFEYKSVFYWVVYVLT